MYIDIIHDIIHVSLCISLHLTSYMYMYDVLHTLSDTRHKLIIYDVLIMMH